MLSFDLRIREGVVVQQTVEIRWLFESSNVECDESDLECYPLLDWKSV